MISGKSQHLLKRTLIYGCMHIYCYVQIIAIYSRCTCLYIQCGTLQWTVYMTLIGYSIYTKVGVLVDA